MKRKRTSPRSNRGQEEEEGGSGDRKHSLRKTKHVVYHEDHEDKDEEENHNQIPPGNWNIDIEVWPVTCGTKSGLMNVEKLEKSKKCIECQGRQFTPPAFEDFAGKGSSKKWKSTIYSDGKPLQHWFEEGLLKTKGYKIKTPIEESEEEFTEDSEEEDVSQRHSGSKNWFSRTEQKEGSVGDRNNGDFVDSDHPEEKQDDKLDQDETEDDGDVLDNPKSFCAPEALSEADPRLMISAHQKQALQVKKVQVNIRRMSMTRSDYQIPSVEHSLEEEEKRDGNSERKCCEKETASQTKELPEISVPEGSEDPIETETVEEATNISPQHQDQEKRVEEKYRKHFRISSVPLSINHSDVSSSDQIEYQTMPESRSIPGSDSTHLSDNMETSASGVLAGSDVDTMDLDQLQRETLKTQLELLRLQKEYYALKLKKLQSYN